MMPHVRHKGYCKTMNPNLSNAIQPPYAEFDALRDAASPRRIRTMREFAEQEIVIPTGPYSGSAFRCSRQPYTRLWFDAIDSGDWQRFAATGPTQSGKTLSCFAIPAMYHLFEYNETVILGVPTLDIVNDKWEEDLLPVIEASRYRDMIPREGIGSRGGKGVRLKFRNGATLRFMTGAPSDKARAAFTARVVIITEADGFDVSRATSREADQIAQLEARANAYGRLARRYKECTVSTEEGRIWRDYCEGTKSCIAMECPYCHEWVTLGRADLLGWQDAANVIEARAKAYFQCPRCKARWTDADRERAAATSRLLHRGQEIRDGRVIGDAPQTDMLGFRWSAPDNILITAGDVAVEEWRSPRERDSDNAEKMLCQFVWAVPPPAETVSLTDLQPSVIMARTAPTGQGILPGETTALTVGVDLGKFLLHWTAVAWRADGSATLVDYGRLEVPSVSFGVEKAIPNALYQLKEQFSTGWELDGGGMVQPTHIGVDSAWQTDVVYGFMRAVGKPFIAIRGLGYSQTDTRGAYYHPARTDKRVRAVGEQYYVTLNQQYRVLLVEANADFWKSFLYERLTVPVGEPGAMTLCNTARPMDHFSIAKHFTSERQVEEYVPGKGHIVKWVHIGNQKNHWLDCTWIACCLGHFAGIRVGQQSAPEPKKPAEAYRPRVAREKGWTIGR